MERVFVAMAMSSRPQDEVLAEANSICAAVAKANMSPYCGAYYWPLYMQELATLDRDYWLVMTRRWLATSDYMLVSSISDGVEDKIKAALNMGIPVFYTAKELIAHVRGN